MPVLVSSPCLFFVGLEDSSYIEMLKGGGEEEKKRRRGKTRSTHKPLMLFDVVLVRWLLSILLSSFLFLFVLFLFLDDTKELWIFPTQEGKQERFYLGHSFYHCFCFAHTHTHTHTHTHPNTRARDTAVSGGYEAGLGGRGKRRGNWQTLGRNPTLACFGVCRVGLCYHLSARDPRAVFFLVFSLFCSSTFPSFLLKMCCWEIRTASFPRFSLLLDFPPFSS